MRYDSRSGAARPSVIGEALEAQARLWVQSRLQDLLEAEVSEFLARGKSVRRAECPGGPAGYRNGHGRPRALYTTHGRLVVQRPRIRDAQSHFTSQILQLYARRTPAVEDLLCTLYLEGLAAGDLERALRGLFGGECAWSEATVRRLKEKWTGEYAAWCQRPLDGLEVVYLWADGVYLKAGLERDKAAVLVLVAGLADGRKVLLALESGFRESTESWGALLRDLRARGLRPPRLVVGDGALGLWSALGQVYPEAEEQRCWNHRVLNVLDRVPKRLAAAGKRHLHDIMYASTRVGAEVAKTVFQTWARRCGCARAAAVLDDDWERMLTFMDYPGEHWGHLRTTNVVESPFAALRLRTDAAKRYRRVEAAIPVVWQTLLIVQQQFRRLNAPHLLRRVWEGDQFPDGVGDWERQLFGPPGPAPDTTDALTTAP